MSRLADSLMVRNGAPRVEQLQRQRLGQQRRDRALAPELGHVVVAVDVVHERHARLAAATAASGT